MRGVVLAVVVAVWVATNDASVRAAARGDVLVLALVAATGPFQALGTIASVLTGDWLGAVVHGAVTAMCARIMWHWWRRRRKGRPSRVLGVVRSIGHRLVVRPVTAPTSS